MTNFSSNYLRLCEKINYEWLNILYYTIAVPWSKVRLLTQRPFYPLILWWLDTMRILMLDQSWNFSPMWNDYFTILSVVWIKINGLIVCKIGCLHMPQWQILWKWTPMLQENTTFLDQIKLIIIEIWCGMWFQTT